MQAQYIERAPTADRPLLPERVISDQTLNASLFPNREPAASEEVKPADSPTPPPSDDAELRKERWYHRTGMVIAGTSLLAGFAAVAFGPAGRYSTHFTGALLAYFHIRDSEKRLTVLEGGGEQVRTSPFSPRFDRGMAMVWGAITAMDGLTLAAAIATKDYPKAGLALVSTAVNLYLALSHLRASKFGS